MDLRTVLRSLLIFAAICIFGLVDAIVKGHHGGTRNAIGNVSAPWALIPFLAGAFVLPRRVVVGPCAGVAATVLALASYSLARSGTHLGHQSGASSVVGSGGLGNRYFLAGVVGGQVLGAAGAWLATHRRWNVVIGVVAVLLALEPAARMIWASERGQNLGAFLPSPSVWGIEILLGCALLAVLHFRRVWRH